MIAVTSFSQSGYAQYGKRMLETAIQYWPTKIIVYHEGKEPELTHDKIEYRNLFNVPQLVTFLQYIQNLPMAHGKMAYGYDYRFDCWKFCRKVFAQIDVIKSCRDKVFWLDADLEFKKKVPEDFLHGLFAEKALAYLGREGWYTETGFVGFDLRGDTRGFLDSYEECYRKGHIFTLNRWHDCEAFDWAIRKSGVIGNNLSSFYVNHESDIDVLAQSVLAEYMTHHKGPAKKREISGAISGDAPSGPLQRQELEEAYTGDTRVN